MKAKFIFIWHKKGRINNLVDIILLLMYAKVIQKKRNMKNYLAINKCEKLNLREYSVYALLSLPAKMRQ